MHLELNIQRSIFWIYSWRNVFKQGFLFLYIKMVKIMSIERLIIPLAMAGGLALSNAGLAGAAGKCPFKSEAEKAVYNLLTSKCAKEDCSEEETSKMVKNVYRFIDKNGNNDNIINSLRQREEYLGGMEMLANSIDKELPDQPDFGGNCDGKITDGEREMTFDNYLLEGMPPGYQLYLRLTDIRLVDKDIKLNDGTNDKITCDSLAGIKGNDFSASSKTEYLIPDNYKSSIVPEKQKMFLENLEGLVKDLDFDGIKR